MLLSTGFTPHRGKAWPAGFHWFPCAVSRSGGAGALGTKGDLARCVRERLQQVSTVASCSLDDLWSSHLIFPFAVGKLQVQTHSVLLKIRQLEQTATEMLYPSDERSLQSWCSINFACGSRARREVCQDFSRLLSFSLPAHAGEDTPGSQSHRPWLL